MRRTPNLKMLSLIWLLLLALGKTQAQQGRNYAIYANIIYRFTKYINWPEDKKTGDFTIGIIGDSPLYGELSNFTANKSVGSQRIVVKRISAPATYGNCQILFVCEDESGSLKKIAALTAGSPVLLLSESDGLAHKGSCINFIVIDEHLKLEINKNNIGQRNLGIASELLSLGILVQ
jgi:YfiR/HmsC-like